MDIPCIFLVDIHGISKDIPCISSLMDIHGISKDIPYIYHVYVGHLHIRGIYQAYSRHMPKIGVPDGDSILVSWHIVPVPVCSVPVLLSHNSLGAERQLASDSPSGWPGGDKRRAAAGRYHPWHASHSGSGCCPCARLNTSAGPAGSWRLLCGPGPLAVLLPVQAQPTAADPIMIA